MKELKSFVAKEAVQILDARTKRWSLGLFEHNTEKMTVYCVARISSLMTEPTFEFYAMKVDALNRFNDILNIIKDDKE